MIKKTLMGLTAAALLASATACQSTTQPAAPATPPTSSVSPAPTAPKPAENSNTPAEPAKPIQTAPEGTTPAPQTPTTPPAAAAPQATAKLYKLNPKSYDIVPIDSAAANKNVVLLTFDDGPKDKDMLEPLLETLDKHHAKAIFL